MMVQVIWDLEDDLQGNFQHIAEHDVTPDEVEEVKRIHRKIERTPEEQRRYHGRRFSGGIPHDQKFGIGSPPALVSRASHTALATELLMKRTDPSHMATWRPPG